MWHDLLITPTDLPKEEFEGYGYSVDVLLRIQLDDEYKSTVHAVGYCQLIEELEGEAVWWSCTERGGHIIDIKDKVLAWKYIE